MHFLIVGLSVLGAAFAFECPGTGNYRDPEDCSSFYECYGDNQQIRRTCPAGLVYNTQGFCDWPANVDCNGDIDPVTKPPTDAPPTGKPGGGIPTKEEAAAREKELTTGDFFDMVKHSIDTLDSSEVDKIAPGLASNPANVKRLESLLKDSDWDFLFPGRNQQYTYRKFLQAVGKFPYICADYANRNADHICKKTLTTMFAHFTQETGGHNKNSATPEWRQGLLHVNEMGCAETGTGCEYNMECTPGSWQQKTWPCGENPDGSWKKYFGRGAKQLSYNYNYGPFSDAMFGTVRTLLDEPTLVATTWLSLASATWFYVSPQPPKPSMLLVIDGTWQPNDEDQKNKLEPGFGATIMIINGGIECGHGYEKPQATNRQKYYREFSKYFKMDISNEELSCAHMKAFSRGGAGAIEIYWEENWKADYECKLVTYQTPYSALKPGDYGKCVENAFGIKLE